MTTKIRLRWKREPAPTGLSRVCSGPRGSYFWDGKTIYAMVDAIPELRGWYWHTWDITPRHNSYATPCKTEAEAKAQAKAYVLKYLSAKEKENESQTS